MRADPVGRCPRLNAQWPACRQLCCAQVRKAQAAATAAGAPAPPPARAHVAPVACGCHAAAARRVCCRSPAWGRPWQARPARRPLDLLPPSPVGPPWSPSRLEAPPQSCLPTGAPLGGGMLPCRLLHGRSCRGEVGAQVAGPFCPLHRAPGAAQDGQTRLQCPPAQPPPHPGPAQRPEDGPPFSPACSGLRRLPKSRLLEKDRSRHGHPPCPQPCAAGQHTQHDPGLALLLPSFPALPCMPNCASVSFSIYLYHSLPHPCTTCRCAATLGRAL